MVRAERRVGLKPGPVHGLRQGLWLCKVSPRSAGGGLGSRSLADKASCPCGAHDSLDPGQVHISLPDCTQLLAVAAPCAGLSLSMLIHGKHKVA